MDFHQSATEEIINIRIQKHQETMFCLMGGGCEAVWMCRVKAIFHEARFYTKMKSKTFSKCLIELKAFSQG